MLTQGRTPDPKCKLNISSFPTRPPFARLSYLYQHFCVHYIVIMHDCIVEWERLRWQQVDSYQGMDEGIGGRVLCYRFF